MNYKKKRKANGYVMGGEGCSFNQRAVAAARASAACCSMISISNSSVGGSSDGLAWWPPELDDEYQISSTTSFPRPLRR